MKIPTFRVQFSCAIWFRNSDFKCILSKICSFFVKLKKQLKCLQTLYPWGFAVKTEKSGRFLYRFFWCRWRDSNPHGFPPDFESGVSAIPPHRHISAFLTAEILYHISFINAIVFMLFSCILRRFFPSSSFFPPIRTQFPKVRRLPWARFS